MNRIDDNDTIDDKFSVVLSALKSFERIEARLDDISQINSTINEPHLSNLIRNSSDVNSDLLSGECLRGQKYQELIRHSDQLEPIVLLTTRLEECVHDPDRFDEAILLLDSADKLYQAYSVQVPIIDIIYKRAKKLRECLISSLCYRLDGFKDAGIEDIKCLVNQLIRCAGYSGRDLRLRYLQARDSWFNNECDVKSESSSEELISFFCYGLPKIFEEYRSLFADECEPANDRLLMMSAKDSIKEDGAIINSWLLLKASTFILSLELHLKSISQSKFLTPTMIGDTMQKCFKLTDWLSSIGFDFSSQLKPLFYRAIIEEVKFSVEQATTRFETEFTKIFSKSIESLLLPLNDEILRISNMRPEEQIPKSIGHYPIFKIYCLHIVESLRWIQTTKCTLSPISLCLDTYAALNASLTRVMKALAVVLNMDNNSNHPILSKIALSFLTEVLPFFTNYCELLFPEKVILSAIGMTKTEFKRISLEEPEKLKNFRLDLRQIADPLRSTMPALMQTIES